MRSTTFAQLPEAWPNASVQETYRRLTAEGMPFEMEQRTTRGRAQRGYRNNFPNLRALFCESRKWGDREFLIFQQERMTYAEHFLAVCNFANTLTDRFGVRKGDRVAIALRNYPEWSVVFWATVIVGAVATPLNAWGTGGDLAYGIMRAGCRIAVVDQERADRLGSLTKCPEDIVWITVRAPVTDLRNALALEELIGSVLDYSKLQDCDLPDVAIAPDDWATIFYTSGTTGKPKGALGTHGNIVTNVLNAEFASAFAAVRRGLSVPVFDATAPAKVVLLPSPFFHVTGCHSTLVTGMARGRTIILMYKWNPEQALELIERERVNYTTGVPSMAWQLLESPKFCMTDISSLEGVSYGGAPAAPELTARVAAALPAAPPRQGYGATETSAVTCGNCGADFIQRPDSVGPPAPVCDVRIVGADGLNVNAGDIGEIWIYGTNVVAGYWDEPVQTAESFSDGWYRTGDVGRMDEDGFVYVLDRIKDVVIRGGENIYCAEVEAAILRHCDVLDVAVFGIPERILGEEVMAVVQCRPNSTLTEDSIRAHLASILSPHKVPRFFQFRDNELPRNASGKILKRELRTELLRQRNEHNNQADG